MAKGGTFFVRLFAGIGIFCEYCMEIINFRFMPFQFRQRVMKKLYMLLLLICLPLAGLDAADKKDYEAYLDSLDYYLQQSDKYVDRKEGRIAVLEEYLKNKDLTSEQRYRYLLLLFDEYACYQSRLMYETAQQLMQLSRQLKDKDKLVNSEISLAYSYLWSGAFKEAYEYAADIDTTQTAAATRVRYLMFQMNLDFESSLYVKPLRFFMPKYQNSLRLVVEELGKLLPPDDDRLLEARQKECANNGQYDKANEYLQQRLRHSAGISRQTAAKLSDVGFMNLEMGDTLTAVKYMVKGAIMDILIGSKQTPALRKIAETIYPDGEVERAYAYIQQAMENAVFFGSGYRMYESSITLPLIDRKLYELTKMQKEALGVIVCIIIVCTVALVFLYVYVRKQNKKLHRSTQLIREQNHSLRLMGEQMREINKELRDANSIKTVYLGRILSDNSSAITDIEELAKMVKLKVKAKQADDLIPFIYKKDYAKKRKEMLASFDAMFLHLFPHFIEKFNSLLKEDCRIAVEDKNALTPELRIFALVRLGITKSDVIGEILNYSSSTVRNYKTKIRNAAVVPNEEFDKRLLEIESEI